MKWLLIDPQNSIIIYIIRLIPGLKYVPCELLQKIPI